MTINIKVSDQYQGVIETAGSPQNSGVSTAITPVNSLSEIPANANGVYMLPSGEILSYVNGVLKKQARLSKRLTTVIIGNSIAAAMKWGPLYGTGRAEQIYLDALLGGALEFPEIVATTRADSRGCYGYSGQTIATINSDIPVQLFNALDAANVQPDVIWGIALYENDIGGTTSYTTMVNETNAFVEQCRARYPGSRIVIAAPRPSFTCDTQSKKDGFVNITKYLQSIANNTDLFVYVPNGYADANDPTIPQKTLIRGTLVGTLLTVNTFISGQPIAIGDCIGTQFITAMTTGSGGVGTYTLGGTQVDIATDSQIVVNPYTDAAVHPNTAAAVINARSALPAFNAIADDFYANVPTISSNNNLSGSIAATGTNVSGTMPTGFVMTGYAVVTNVLQALTPGLRVTASAIADSATMQQIASITMSDLNPLPTNAEAFRVFCKFRIVSGAEYIYDINSTYRTTDNGTLGGSTDWISNRATGQAGISKGIVNGDVLTMRSPIMRSSIGSSFTRLLTYLNVYAKARCPASAVIVYEVLEQGFELPNKNKGFATLVGGTATVAQGANITALSKIKLGIKTIGGTPGALFVSAITAGTSFVITSTNAADTSVVSWEIDNA